MGFYRQIFKRIFKISFKNKWLWVVGFFAAFLGNGSVYEALLRGFNNISEGRSVFHTFYEYSQSGVLGMVSWSNLTTLWQSDAAAFGWGVFVMLLGLSIFAIFITLAVISQGAVIKGVVDIDQGKKTGLKQSFKHGVKHFWPILELNVITKIILFGFLLLLSFIVSLVIFASHAMNIFFYTLFFIIFIILGIIIYFLTIYGTAFIVLREKKTFAALKSAWHLFKSNVLLNLEMGLLLFIMNFLVVLAIIIGALFLLSPFLVLYILFAGGGGALSMVLAICIVTVLIILSVFIGAWWTTFQLGAWAILFEQLASYGGKSKIRRIYEAIVKRKIKK